MGGLRALRQCGPRLLDGRGDVAEGRVQLGAKTLYDGDNRDRNAGGDETIFNGGRAILIPSEVLKQGTHICCPLSAVVLFHRATNISFDLRSNGEILYNFTGDLLGRPFEPVVVTNRLPMGCKQTFSQRQVINQMIHQLMTWVQTLPTMANGIAMCLVIAAYLVYRRYTRRPYKSL